MKMHLSDGMDIQSMGENIPEEQIIYEKEKPFDTGSSDAAFDRMPG